ncbi:hypothetical protein MKW92_004330, partial [Papaver armeniacum]
MSSTLIGAAEEGRTAISLMTSSPSLEISGFRERNYMGLSDFQELSLPSSGRLDEKTLFPLLCYEGFYLLVIAKGRGLWQQERVFRRHGWVFEVKSTVYNEGNWMFPASWSDSNRSQSGGHKENYMLARQKVRCSKSALSRECHRERDYTSQGIQSDVNRNQISPLITLGTGCRLAANKVIPKNTLATTTKTSEEVDGKPGPSALYVKVSMDGAPYLRKVDLNTYVTIGAIFVHVGHMELPGRESKHRDLLHGSNMFSHMRIRMVIGCKWEMCLG